MFERSTESAPGIVVFAQEEARALKHDYLGATVAPCRFLLRCGADPETIHGEAIPVIVQRPVIGGPVA